MNKDFDSVDQALAALRSQRWSREQHRDALEEQLMKNLDIPIVSRGKVRYRTIAAVVGAAVLIGGGAFAAAGGPEAVKKWFVTLRLVGADGGEYHAVLEPTAGDDGAATMQFQTPDGRTADVQVRRVDPTELGIDPTAAGGPMTMVQVSMDGAGSAAGTGPTILTRAGEAGSMVIGEPGGTATTIEVTASGGDARHATIDVSEQGGQPATGGAAAMTVATVTATASNDGHDGGATVEVKTLDAEGRVVTDGANGHVVRVERGAMNPDGTTTFTATVVPADGAAADVRVPHSTEAIAAAVDAADPLEEWVDGNGRSAALYALADPLGADGPKGWFVYVVRTDGDGGRTFDLAGSVRGVDAAVMPLDDLQWDEGDVATLSFLGDDGRRIEIKVDASDEAAAKRANALQKAMSGSDPAKPVRVRLQTADAPGR